MHTSRSSEDRMDKISTAGRVTVALPLALVAQFEARQSATGRRRRRLAIGSLTVCRRIFVFNYCYHSITAGAPALQSVTAAGMHWIWFEMILQPCSLRYYYY